MKNFLTQIDLQDILLITGPLCLVGGVGSINGPAGIITAGVLSLLVALLIERAKSKSK